MTQPLPHENHPAAQESRRRHMAVLARADRAEIQTLLNTVQPIPAVTILKAPETGTVMVEGRAGGAGSRFNLGEATMTRCIVRLEGGEIGFSYALGRDREKARLAAIVDALLQQAPAGSGLQDGILQDGILQDGIKALAERQQAAKDQASRKAAATKVEFFTLVRGEG